MSRRSQGRVYSTQFGEMCGVCEQPVARCRCATKGAAASGVPDDGIVRVARSKKGRKGSGVTEISGVPLGAAELAALGKELKRACGSGGTVRGGVIEIQGEHRDRLIPLLEARGWRVKRVGG